MRNVLTEIRQWATGLEYWEQAALDKIASGVQFTEDDYQELLQYLIEDADLASKTADRPVLRFPQTSAAQSGAIQPIKLIQISNLQNINALVKDQRLTFGAGVTAVYGANGSGKSGYARVLGCAGFTRGDQQVLPDVTRLPDEQIALTAEIEIFDGSENRTIYYQVGHQCQDLASLYVFDSTSVRVHLTGENTLSFSPAGLSYLKQLADATDQVRARLRTRIEDCSQPHCLDTLFQGDSPVKELIGKLGPDTDLKKLQELATLSQEDLERVPALDLQIAQLIAQDPSEKITELQQDIDDLKLLSEQLANAQATLSEEVVDHVRACITTHQEIEETTRQLGLDQFKSEHFSQTGTDLWYEFIRSARALADAETIDDQTYPWPESRCLLCQQPLSPEARGLLFRLWTFLESEAEEKLAQAQSNLVEHSTRLASVDLDFFDDQTVSYRYLQAQKPDLLNMVRTYVTACNERRQALQLVLSDLIPDFRLASLPESGDTEISQIVAQLESERKCLEKRDILKEIETLKTERQALENRRILSEHLDEAQAYIQRRLWARKASTKGGSTRHITKKHNDLFKALVTDRYVESFERMLQDLGRPLNVQVATHGRKGQVYRHIELKAAVCAEQIGATPDKVLSEGEKRAVALADFLTEVALDDTSSSIVLDDPVTSLDLEWRQFIAHILATEAKRRQVVVFTHDLPFLYYLTNSCSSGQVDVCTHWIKRGDSDGRPGYVWLDNSPALERDYRRPTRACALYDKARNAPPELQQALLKEGCGALRATYEAFIIFDLLNEVVTRFSERISFGALKQVVLDEAIVDEVIAKCEMLSRYIEGHLHTDGVHLQDLDPPFLLQEIESFQQLRKRYGKLRDSQ